MSNQIVYQPSQTTHWRNLFQNKSMLLGAHNLNEGEELVCQIDNVSINPITNQNGKEERVPVLTFTNAPPMVLNITNTKTIAGLYGERYDLWIGKYIQVYPAKVKAFGVEQTALRIRPIVPTNGYDMEQYKTQLSNCQNLDELKQVYMSLPNNIKSELSAFKDQIKNNLGA